jgi:hypothetical protein
VLVFLDFEASSLSKHSYPIEVAWVFETGEGESHLIRPEANWTDWDESAAAIHGISRAKLQSQGEAADAVSHRLVEALQGHELYASAPSWDGKWLSMLLRAGGFPRHLMKLAASRDAYLAAAGGDEAVVTAVRATIETEPVEHRALPDAQRDRQIWYDIRRTVAEQS